MSKNTLPAIIGGAGGSPPKPHVPRVASDSLRSASIAEFVDALGEGEFEGFATADPYESVYLENTPIRTAGVDNFEGVTLDYRLGTQSQTHFENVKDGDNPTSATEFAVNTNVIYSTPVTRTITSTNTDAAIVTVQLNALYGKTAKGDVIEAAVDVVIQVRASGGSYVTPDLAGRNHIVGKTGSPYRRSFTIKLKQYGSAPYDIRVSRAIADNTDGTVVDAFSWTSYVEVIYAKLRMPNTALAMMSFDAKHFQSIPRRGFLMKGMKVKVPNGSVYNPVARTYTGAFWDGTFTTAWTRNPVWALYDILTNARYGLGDKINVDDIDKWELFKIAKRCDELVPNGSGGTEPRYSLDLFLQENKGAKQVVQDIASSFDGMAYWGAGKVFVTQDSPKDVTAIYTNANVVGGTFTYAGSGKQVRYTAALVQWNDPTDFYRVAIEYVEDPYGIERYGYQEVSLVAMGCTSRAQAHRHGKRAIVTGRLETDTVVFSVGLEGMVAMPGAIIGIRDTTRFTGDRLGGRLPVAPASSTSFTLDAPTVIGAGQHYLSIYKADGAILTANVTNAAGTHTVINTSTAIAGADQYDIWAIHTDSNKSKYYRVLGVSESTEELGSTYVITAIQYDPSKYTIIDSPLSLQNLLESTSINLVLAPTNLVISDGVYTNADNVLKRYVEVSWTPSKDKFLEEHVLSYTFDGAFTPKHITGLEKSYRIDDPQAGVYHFEIRAKNTLGIYSQPLISVPDYTVTPLFAVTAVSVINMGVKGPDPEFVGRNAEIHWETDADVILDLPTNYSNGVGGSTHWFRDFEIKIFTPDGLTLLRTEYTTEYAYSYTFEKNVQDGGPRREFKVVVRARDEFGNFSLPGEIVPINHPPQMPATIQTIPKEGSIAISFTTPEDPDFKYSRLFGSKTQGFTPGPANLLWEGPGNYIFLPINAADAGTWYLRMQFVDEFGIDGAIYSGEGVQIATAIEADLPANIASDILNLIIDFNAANNRDGSAIANPTFATNQTAIDHTLNADGTINISIEWGWTGDEGTIDGFGIYARWSTSSAPYTFNGLSPEEVVIQVPAKSRAYIHHGIPARANNGAGGTDPLYYTIGVVAFRKVDKDIAASGVIASAIVKATASDENPYCPVAVNPASGDITTTIDGILAANVNVWNSITGAGRPWDNADVTKDQLGGNGINILNDRYAIINESSLPPYVVTGGTVTLAPADVASWGYSIYRLTASSALATLWLGGSTIDYNFIVTPGKRWILSCYVRSSTANASGSLTIRGNNGGTYGTFDFLTSATPNTPTRVSGIIDATANNSSLAILRAENDAGNGVYIDFSGFMMEEMIGNVLAPSAFSRPAVTAINGVSFEQVLNNISDFNLANNRNSSPVTAPVVPSDNSALDYVTNNDGSVDVSLEWTWAGNEGDIDGFAIFAYSTKTNHGVYSFGTNPTLETVFQVPANRRSYIANGISADSYYTVAVMAYRAVDKDVSANGVINSAFVYANGSTERPFRPNATIAFNGNITGSVNNIAVATLTGNAANGNTAFDGTAIYRQNVPPTNNPVPTGITIVNNPDGSRDITLSWTYTQGAIPAEGIGIAYVEGTGTVLTTSPNVVVAPGTTSYRFTGVSQNVSYRAGIAAFRNTESGVQIGPVIQPISAPDWRITGGTPNITSNINGVAAATVTSNAANGQTAYSSTITYRTAGAPTNAPSPTSVGIVENSNGTRDITLNWGAYTQGALAADGLAIIYKEGTAAVTVNDVYVTTNVNVGVAGVYKFLGVDPTKSYRVGICAYRQSNVGIEVGTISQPTPTWQITGAAAPNYTGNLGGQTVAAVTAGGVNGQAAYDGTAMWRSTSAPTNNPVPTTISITENSDGTRDITLAWTYTQGAILADSFAIGYELGTASTITTASPHIVVPVASRSYRFTGVSQAGSYRVGMAALRNSEGGTRVGTIVQPISAPDWRVTGIVPDITAKIGGVAAATVHSNISAAASTAVWTGVTSRPTTLSGINSTEGTKLTGIEAGATLGASFTTNLSNKPASVGGYSTAFGASAFSGTITGSAGLNVSGAAVFTGAATADGSSSCVTGVTTTAGYVGVKGSATTWAGVFGYATNGVGVRGSSPGASGYGGQFSGGARALDVQGAMSINNSTQVANLNANYLGGFSQAQFVSILSGNTGQTTRVSGSVLQVATSISGYTCVASGTSVVMQVSSDRRLKHDITPEMLGLDFVLSRKPVSYKLIEGEQITRHGFIAQEMQDAFPKANKDALLVHHENTGMYGVGMTDMIAPLTKAIQELHEIIKSQGNEIAQLKKQLNRKLK